jgi:glycine/serine hydroxymethyltransferase
MEQKRQFKGVELIASENFAYRYVADALGSEFSNWS